MGFRVGDEFIDLLVKRGLIPEDTISVDIRIRYGDVPIMTVERMPDGEIIEYFLESIGVAERITPLPPEPEVRKPPATEGRP